MNDIINKFLCNLQSTVAERLLRCYLWPVILPEHAGYLGPVILPEHAGYLGPFILPEHAGYLWLFILPEHAGYLWPVILPEHAGYLGPVILPEHAGYLRPVIIPEHAGYLWPVILPEHAGYLGPVILPEHQHDFYREEIVIRVIITDSRTDSFTTCGTNILYLPHSISFNVGTGIFLLQSELLHLSWWHDEERHQQLHSVWKMRDDRLQWNNFRQ